MCRTGNAILVTVKVEGEKIAVPSRVKVLEWAVNLVNNVIISRIEDG